MPRHRAIIAIACLLAVAGCAGKGPRGSIATTARPAGYQQVRVAYRIDAGALGMPLAVSKVGAQLVSYEELPSEPLRGRSVGTLEIAYPHPAKREGMALVGVVVQQRGAEKRGMMPDVGQMWRGLLGRDELFLKGADRELHEAWVLDIPKAELDQILTALNRQQFFEPNSPSPSQDSVRLVTALDGQETSRVWHAVPELDGLMQRVRSSGQLISYRGASLPATSAWQPPASLAAYNHIQAVEANLNRAQGETLFASPSPPASVGGPTVDPFQGRSIPVMAEAPAGTTLR